MAAPDLLQIFESVILPMPGATGQELAAVPIPGVDTHRVAKDAFGAPCILIRQRALATRSVPIRLENLIVSFDVRCKVRDRAGKLEDDTFTIIRCSSRNPSLYPHFLMIFSPIVLTLGITPTGAAVHRAILGIAELFQALSAPAKKTVQGLWSEVLLIRLSRDPVALAAAWRRDPVEHFDFVAGPQRIEVKSSATRQRNHHFSLEQLTTVGPSHIVIVSVFVERVGGGVSLRKLFEETRQRLVGDLQLLTHFDTVFYKSLGSGWEDAMDDCFDWELAVGSIAYYQAESIPRPDNRFPQTVSDVRFRADLGSLTPCTLQELRDVGSLVAAALPEH